MSVEFRRARAEDARLLAETRRRAWDTTYRGIYPDAMIDEYDLEAHTARDAARIADPANAVFLAMDGAECVGYFTYGPYTYGRYKDFALCLNSLYFLPGYRRMGLGRRAFAQLTEFCRERGIEKFFCGCNCHNLPAQAFYRANKIDTVEKLDALLNELTALAVPGPQLFPDDMISDMPEKQICAELVREKLLLCLDKEIPHGTAVEVTKFSERDNGIIDMDVTIYCEKDSHKGIIIGKHGAMLKKIGELARQDIERFMGTKVYLQTWVKVKENWRDSAAQLRNFGFTDQ